MPIQKLRFIILLHWRILKNARKLESISESFHLLFTMVQPDVNLQNSWTQSHPLLSMRSKFKKDQIEHSCPWNWSNISWIFNVVCCLVFIFRILLHNSSTTHQFQLIAFGLKEIFFMNLELVTKIPMCFVTLIIVSLAFSRFQVTGNTV